MSGPDVSGVRRAALETGVTGVGDIPQLGPLPRRITVTADMAARLVAQQFAQWAGEPVRAVARGGWDNWTFRLGADKVLRLPSAPEYALAVAKEHRWLPRLAAALPVPVPRPLATGAPAQGYPFAWSVYEWIEGTPASFDAVADPVRFAADLADAVAALQRVEASDGPQPGTHNWYRGATVRTYEAQALHAIDDLRGHIDEARARQVWAEAVAATWDRVDVWFHGDLAPGNLLLSDGHLCAVIDFGTCGVGDPACDLAVAWTLLTPQGRSVFRSRLGVDDGTWARGRGWALWKALVSCVGPLDEGPDAVDARRVLTQVLADGDRA